MTFKPLSETKKSHSFVSWSRPKRGEEAKEDNSLEVELEQKKQQAYDEAYQKGFNQGMQEAQIYQDKVMALLGLLKEPIALIDETVEQEVLETLLWLCKYCIGIELEQTPEKITALIEQIKPHFPIMQEQKKLHLNEQDSQIIRDFMSHDEWQEFEDIIINDASLARGEFLLSSQDSELDGRFSARLDAILRQRQDK